MDLLVTYDLFGWVDFWIILLSFHNWIFKTCESYKNFVFGLVFNPSFYHLKLKKLSQSDENRKQQMVVFKN